MIGFGQPIPWRDFDERKPEHGDIITVAYRRPGKRSMRVRFEEYDERANHDHYVFWCVGAPGICHIEDGEPVI